MPDRSPSLLQGRPAGRRMKTDEAARLFLALWPDAGTRAALARCRDAWAWAPGAAPEVDERLHLTLHFLGTVERARVPALIEGLQLPCPRFTLQLDRSERWPNGVAVLASTADPPALLALHAALRERIEALGLPTDARPWRAHVTLARRAGDSAAPAQVQAVRWPARGYALVASRSAPRAYVVLRHYV